jgi:hypothetical protein
LDRKDLLAHKDSLLFSLLAHMGWLTLSSAHMGFSALRLLGLWARLQNALMAPLSNLPKQVLKLQQ